MDTTKITLFPAQPQLSSAVKDGHFTYSYYTTDDILRSPLIKLTTDQVSQIQGAANAKSFEVTFTFNNLHGWVTDITPLF